MEDREKELSWSHSWEMYKITAFFILEFLKKQGSKSEFSYLFCNWKVGTLVEYEWQMLIKYEMVIVS